MTLSNHSLNILITGASGFIGRFVVSEAMRRGMSVRTLSRRDWLGAPYTPAESHFLGALPYCLAEKALEDIDAVIHLANTMGSEDMQTARAVNVEGTRRLIAAAKRNGCKKFVYISSQSAKEDATSSYGVTKLETEKVVKDGGIPWTILRPGLVYGPGAHDIFSRMAETVRKLPAIPVLGSGKAPVQPIYVADLADAILRCAALDSHAGETFCLGAEQPITLCEFLQKIATILHGKPKPVARIPLKPVLWGVQIFEQMGIPLPVTSNNLKGLERVEMMPTAPSLQKLGLKLRPLDDGLASIQKEKDARAPQTSEIKNQCAKSALIGAGRIGLMHSVTMERARGIRLAAMIDPNPKATKLLRGIGIASPSSPSIEEALSHHQLDAAIIATPPRTHLDIARKALGAGMAVLVEKPLAADPAQLDQFARLENADRAMVGYYAPSLPQFEEALKELRAGRFGAVTEFEGYSLQSLFPGPKRWEVNPRLSGGGALINLGGHVLSMIHAAFGAPKSIQAAHHKVTSDNVEDSIAVRLEYATFQGNYYTGWCIQGFPQAEMRLIIHTDSGRLFCTNTIAAFIHRDGELKYLKRQQDYSRGFNLSPDYIGGGITAEINQLRDLARNAAPPVTSLTRAIELDKTIFSIYGESKECSDFALDWLRQTKPAASASNPSANSKAQKAYPGCILDLRRMGLDDLDSAVRNSPQELEPWDGFQTTAPQAKHLIQYGMSDSCLTVVAPDFLNYARMLSGGRAMDFLKMIGAGPVVSLAAQAFRSVASNRGSNFWAIAQALLAADLALLPSSFSGTVLLHSFIGDLAVGVERPREIDALLRIMRARLPGARIGVQTNILPEALNCLSYVKTPIQALHFLSAPEYPGHDALVRDIQNDPRRAECVSSAEIGFIPSALYPHVCSSLDEWREGANRVVLDAICDPAFSAARKSTIERAWAAAFPGSAIPDGAL